MAIDGWKSILLGSLLVVLSLVVYRTVAGSKTASPTGAAPRSQSSGGSSGAAAAPTAPDVHLEALQGERPAPAAADRNLFRFKTRSTVSPGAATQAGPAATQGQPPPTGPAGPPPIGLKFIGIVEQPGTNSKIAILSDGQGPPMFGTEGGTVAGRYRVLRIGVESIELSYLDGRGRQTIRLTGG